MAAPRRQENKNSTQVNKHRMTKQHSSSMYVGLLLSTSNLSLCLFSSSSSGSCAASWDRVLYSIPRFGTMSPSKRVQSQCNLEVWFMYQSTGSKSLQSRPGPHYCLTLIQLLWSCVMPIGNSCWLILLAPTKLLLRGDTKWLQKVIQQVRASTIGNPWYLFVYVVWKQSNWLLSKSNRSSSETTTVSKWHYLCAVSQS